MCSIALAVSGRFGIPVTYEDPPFASATDLISLLPNTPAVTPKAVCEQLSYPRAAALDQVLRAAVNRHNAIGAGGQFEVRQVGEVLGLVPTQCRNKNDRFVEYHSILDDQVTLSLREGDSCAIAVSRVVEQLARRHPEVLVIGAPYPGGLLAELPFSRPKTSANAREVLNEILKILNAYLSKEGWLVTWQMGHMPAIRVPGMEKEIKASSRLCFRPVKIRPNLPFGIRIEAERPMATAVDVVQQRFGVIVTYEEPTYTCPCDVLGIAGSGHARLAGGIIELDWDESHDTADAVLALLVNTPIVPRLPANAFAVERVATKQFHVYPTKTTDSDKKIIAVSSQLGRPVPLDVPHATIAAAAGACVAKALGVKSVDVEARGDAVVKGIQQPLVTLPRPGQTTREALNTILLSTHPDWSWQLLYNPAAAAQKLVIYDVKAP
jgi:hypothetical protein